MTDTESADNAQPQQTAQEQTKPEPNPITTRMEKGPVGLQAWYVAPSAEAAVSASPVLVGGGDSSGSSDAGDTATESGQTSIVPTIAAPKATSDNADR